MKTENRLAEMEILFLALADKTRLKLLNLMRENEVCVYYFTEVLNVSQPKISRHLAYLRSAGIVSARRDGKWMNYRIDFPEDRFAAQLLEDAIAWLKSQPEMIEDYEKLVKMYAAIKDSEQSVCASASQTFAQTNMNRRQKEELDVFLL